MKYKKKIRKCNPKHLRRAGRCTCPECGRLVRQDELNLFFGACKPCSWGNKVCGFAIDPALLEDAWIDTARDQWYAGAW